MSAPEIGQTWEDLDPRAPGRRVLITSVRLDRVFATVTANPKVPHAIGREIQIALERLKPGARGYRLVSR